MGLAWGGGYLACSHVCLAVIAKFRESRGVVNRPPKVTGGLGSQRARQGLAELHAGFADGVQGCRTESRVG